MTARLADRSYEERRYSLQEYEEALIAVLAELAEESKHPSKPPGGPPILGRIGFFGGINREVAKRVTAKAIENAKAHDAEE